MELAIPHLRILDYERAVAFYVNILGFEIDFEWRNEPGLPVYMGIRHGTLYAHLSEYGASGPPGQGRGMTLAVADPDMWYRSLKEEDVPFKHEIRDSPWGGRDFIVYDPFENSIAFITADPG
jgi:catechol 2,3-dioxygenase-like lactoylglutathione lyase family enzyme